MKKCYYVSGKKYGKQKMTVVNTKEQAENLLHKVEFQRGWKYLGISSGDCKTTKQIEEDIGSKVK